MFLKRIGRAAAIGWISFAILNGADTGVSLIDAVKSGDRASVRTRLAERVDVNAADVDGTTALHWAAQRDDPETAEMLVRAGANASAPDRYGVRPLGLAAINGNATIIQLLLNAGADPDLGMPGEPVLLTAARTGRIEALDVLLNRGGDPNTQDSETGQTALMWAAAEGNTAAVVDLLKRGANINARSKGGFTALLFATREGRIDVVRELLKAGVKPDDVMGDTGVTAMVLAAANQHYEVAATLLDAGADPNANGPGWTALHQVTWVRKPGSGTNNPSREGSGNMTSVQFVRKLAARGADPNARMTKGADRDDVATILNMRGATPFLMAARTADAELMRLLVELGADPITPNVDNTTPIMVAAGLGTRSPGEDPGTEPEILEAVKVALEFGGDINGIDNNGDTVMHGAAYKEVPSVVQFLSEHGARVEVWNRKNRRTPENVGRRGGWTPLRIAEGVYFGAGVHMSAETADVLRKVMSEAGVSTVVDPDLDAVTGAK